MVDSYRPTWAEVNLRNLTFNFRQLKKRAGKNVKILAAVKANAYGHGMVQVSRTLERCGVDYLGLASVDEAVLLRKEGVRVPLLMLGSIFSTDAIRKALRLNMTMTVADYRSAVMINRCAGRHARAKVHIKIDTGMGRLGLWHEQAEDIIARIIRLSHLDIEGIYTHFPSADTDMRFTRKQVAIFEALLRRLKKKNISFPLAHAANSIAVGRISASFLTMVRPGIMLYGMYPDTRRHKDIALKPVLCFKTRVVYLKQVGAGRTISYGRTYTTKRKTTIATLPVGYADGYVRALSNKAKVLIRGKFFPVAGRICMDQTMVDVGSSSIIKIGDEVVLLGRQKGRTISAQELAAICRTIPYEITCWISSRVRRVFKNY